MKLVEINTPDLENMSWIEEMEYFLDLDAEIAERNKQEKPKLQLVVVNK